MFAYREIGNAFTLYPILWLVAWFLGGLFGVFMMKKSDAAAGYYPYFGTYWLKGCDHCEKTNSTFLVISAIFLGFLSFLVGIWAMVEWIIFTRRNKIYNS